MNKFFQKIEEFKYGLLAALAAYIILFMYVQIQSYEQHFVIKGFGSEQAELIQPEEIEIQPENIDMQSFNANTQDIKNLVADQNDTRKKSKDDYSESKASAKDVAKSVKEFEAQLFKEAEGNQKREKLLKDHEEKLKKQKEQNTNNQKTNKTQSGGDKAFAGKTMVSFSMKNRTPFENNFWYIRNPGYTCGSNESGEITMRVKIDQSGKVVSAVYASDLSSSTNPCMMEQAKKYALMSRFNYSSSAPSAQEGTISYVFMAQ
jgi:hypothetical protein